jgi:hypothetical protein
MGFFVVLSYLYHNAESLFHCVCFFQQNVTQYYASLQKAAKEQWLPKVGPELERRAIRVADDDPPSLYDDLGTIAWARLVLGPRWVPSSSVLAEQTPTIAALVSKALAFKTLVTAVTTPGETSVGTQARTGLVLLDELKRSPSDSSTKASLEKISSQISGALRVSGRVAYVASGPGSASAASAEDQAFALLFLTLYKPKMPLLQKLAAYVGGGQVAASAALCADMGGTQAGSTAWALASYDSNRGSTQPNLKLTAEATRAAASSVSTKPFSLLSASFTPANAGSVQRSNHTYGEISKQLGGQPNRATFSAKGTGEVSVALGLDFIPAQLLLFPSYRGLWVDAIIQKETGEGRLTAAPLASIVTVAIQITTPDDIGPVKVEARMPGGLEPLDPNVYPDIGSSLTCSFSRYWFWCPKQETSSALVKFSFAYLSAGAVSVRFKAVAATPGQFVLPPVKAYAVQQPEVMGLSAAGSFLVCPTKPTAGQQAVVGCSGSGLAQGKPLPVPKGCPKECSGNGVCNFADGVCVCNAGFTGAACDRFAATR